MGKKYGNILDLIGNTPLAPIRRIRSNPRVTILAKIESFNPGGSVKDRIALSMIETAEQSGELTREKTIIEASSGNTGIGLALVSAVKGYRCLIAMSEGASLERRKIMQAYGAEILLTPAEKSTDGAIEAVYELAREYPDKYYLTDQFNNPANWKAHYYGTGPEIWRDTEGKVTHVVAGMGTTGTLMGIARFFRDKKLPVKVIGLEPNPGHRLQGLKNMKESYPPGIFQKQLLDEIMNVPDEESFELARRLAREEGIFVGMSSGAALYGALELAKRIKEGVIVAIFPDGGERYLSTPLWSFENLPDEGPKFNNTLTRKVERFTPINEAKVGIYTCGPTVNRRPHLGLYRRMMTADLLKRYLMFKGYEVTHVINITDYDDKTIKASFEEGLPLKELTKKIEKDFFEDLKTLGILPATYFPRASEHIDEMISVTRRLIEKGFAYVRHGSVYFDVSKLKDYGLLSKADLAKLKRGATVDLEEYDKDDPLDFTLFKRATLQELKQGLYVETEWGKVRPGWHIQCAAMSLKYLGEEFDIHTSGTDLIFPHHEDEIAIAKALTGKIPARYWLHSALVSTAGKKMSFSAGNAVTIPELLEQGFSPREIRYFLLRTHYRKPLNFSLKALKDAQKALHGLDAFMVLLSREPSGKTSYPVDQLVENFLNQFEEALDDDLNVSRALAVLFEFTNRLEPILAKEGLDQEDFERVKDALEKINTVFGIIRFAKPATDQEVLTLLEKREEARQKGSFEEADKIREELKAQGFWLIDTPRGSIAASFPDED
ncbi:cysteine--tRNA ligase [Thermodesulfatator atlanticus]|uniref:cysteine--tRNA ligase n=1 Tax=Thermodesulfatator atlanticus TaxID=501497 RepID=UPI0003B4EDA2|nr:cysteine--tRNA ligase [Thermodesulfatator atlanticus]